MQRPESAGLDVLALAFSICGDRIIAVSDAKPGRCADLPPMAVPDRVFGGCGAYCTGPYEGMPAVITARERIAPASEPGEPLTVTGRVFGAEGRPRSGILVYGYQTDRNGVYPDVHPPRSYVSNFQGRLRGWARTDARGRYRFDTIRPGSYGGNPAHIHMQVVEPGCSTYRIDDLMFAGDPLLERLTPGQRQNETPGVGGSGVGTLRHKGKAWEVTRDIRLGEKLPGYEPCSAAR
jgi:protocatechuate 3,4-dioxygenase beta subunit